MGAEGADRLGPDRLGKVALIGCGRLGSAMLEGWLASGAVAPQELMVVVRRDSATTEAAHARGVMIRPDDQALKQASVVVLAVKPAAWREAAAELDGRIADHAVIASVMAGVRADDLAAAFAGRTIVRIMPTTGVAQMRGVASIWSNDLDARLAARALFAPMAEVVDLAEEDLIDAATAVSGSGPAYFHAFAKALADAGVTAGLSPDQALTLARATLVSAAAGVAPGVSLDELIARIASPGGTTEAGLKALTAGGRLDQAAAAAVNAAVNRARELSRQ